MTDRSNRNLQTGELDELLFEKATAYMQAKKMTRAEFTRQAVKQFLNEPQEFEQDSQFEEVREGIDEVQTKVTRMELSLPLLRVQVRSDIRNALSTVLLNVDQLIPGAKQFSDQELEQLMDTIPWND